MKILMVCLGNICRSPLAEGIMQHLVEQNKLHWKIDSAGTGKWHVGEGPHRGSVHTARRHGIDILAPRFAGGLNRLTLTLSILFW